MSATHKEVLFGLYDDETLLLDAVKKHIQDNVVPIMAEFERLGAERERGVREEPAQRGVVLVGVLADVEGGEMEAHEADEAAHPGKAPGGDERAARLVE